MTYGRGKGARSWQEHFDSILRSEEARQRGFTVEAHPKCPTLCYVREANGVIELHVDDGPGCGKETVIAELLSFLSEKIEMKVVQGIKCGSYKYLKTVKVRDGKKLTVIPNKKPFAIRGALRVALMNYLEAEDDGHGPVPMEVGAMKGKKVDRGKKVYGKGEFGKKWESTTKVMSTARGTITAKAVRKEEKEERKAK